uniref:BTB domain-containing protein n=1 Tax=Chlamydomonas leiostraca TaxID=1034604 RepID=A0A7S0S2G6_9CHLO|mmetsp:Transcript_37554/g.94806  ORF Transcript_37554/g.94806 Transcript_37554/m.94806 type:complete len:629 (+) Transcript_37554:150-2036(+)
MFSEETLAELWASKAMSDVIVVFSTEPEAVKAAAEAAAEQAEEQVGATRGRGRASRGRGRGRSTSPANGNARHKGVKRSADEDEVQWPEGSVVVSAHRVVLCSSSDYFKAQLLNDSLVLHKPLHLPQPDGSRLRVLVVGVGAQWELDVAERVLHLMYAPATTTQLQAQPWVLLQACQLAQQLQAPAVVKTCAAALAATPEQHLSLPFDSQVLCLLDTTSHAVDVPGLDDLKSLCTKHADSMLDETEGVAGKQATLAQVRQLAELQPSQLHITLASKLAALLDALEAGGELQRHLKQHAQLQALCQGSAMQHLGDAAVVANSAQLLKQFRRLHLSLLKHWVATDEVATDGSENCVVWLLDAWHEEQARHAKTRPQKDKLAEDMAALSALVRVRRLTPSFLHAVLPGIAWFQPARLLPLAAAAQAAGALQAPCAKVLGHEHLADKVPGIPKAWVSSPARTGVSAATPSVLLAVSKDRLEQAVSEAVQAGKKEEDKQKLCSEAAVVQGFSLQASLEVVPDVKAAGRARIVIKVGCAKVPQRRFPTTLCLVPTKYTLACMTVKGKETTLSATYAVMYDDRNWRHVWDNTFGVGSVSSASELAKCMQADQLQATVMWKEVDGVAGSALWQVVE